MGCTHVLLKSNVTMILFRFEQVTIMGSAPNIRKPSANLHNVGKFVVEIKQSKPWMLVSVSCVWNCVVEASANLR